MHFLRKHTLVLVQRTPEATAQVGMAQASRGAGWPHTRPPGAHIPVCERRDKATVARDCLFQIERAPCKAPQQP